MKFRKQMRCYCDIRREKFPELGYIEMVVIRLKMAAWRSSPTTTHCLNICFGKC